MQRTVAIYSRSQCYEHCCTLMRQTNTHRLPKRTILMQISDHRGKNRINDSVRGYLERVEGVKGASQVSTDNRSPVSDACVHIALLHEDPIQHSNHTSFMPTVHSC